MVLIEISCLEHANIKLNAYDHGIRNNKDLGL